MQRRKGRISALRHLQCDVLKSIISQKIWRQNPNPNRNLNPNLSSPIRVLSVFIRGWFFGLVAAVRAVPLRLCAFALQKAFAREGS